ncbi:MAG: STAS-like domain-containing protein [Terriglobia bacterium]
MPKVRPRGEEIRRFITENVGRHPADISKITAVHFQITRQAVNKHLHMLLAGQKLAVTGNTRNRSYELLRQVDRAQQYPINDALAEDIVWTKDIAPLLGQQPENVLDIWQYGFTEMFNNAKDHSEGSEIIVGVTKTAFSAKMYVKDNGVGIFRKIQMAMNLADERHAVLELSKGKLTTDSKHHTGEGIFFSSRMFDDFMIYSGNLAFSHRLGDEENWLLEGSRFLSGTTVWMELRNSTPRTVKEIFDQYASGKDFDFSKTVVPLKLAQYGNDKLISRSQAKRVLARVELFTAAVFDFTGIDTIGQAFADEIFRVFPSQHPGVEIIPTNASPDIERMIKRVKPGEAGPAHE